MHQTPSPYLHPQTPRADLQQQKQKHTYTRSARTRTHTQTCTLSVISQDLITNPTAYVYSSQSRKMSLSSKAFVGKYFEFRSIFPPANPTQTYINGQLLPWLLHKHKHTHSG